jgi:uncharacterized membrane-anchored protein
VRYNRHIINKGIEMIKTYTVAGIATDKQGNTKVRYANDLNQRLKVLARDGFTNLNFIVVDTPKTKQQLCTEMLGLIQFENNKELINKEILDVNQRLKAISRKATLFSGSAEQ